MRKSRLPRTLYHIRNRILLAGVTKDYQQIRLRFPGVHHRYFAFIFTAVNPLREKTPPPSLFLFAAQLQPTFLPIEHRHALLPLPSMPAAPAPPSGTVMIASEKTCALDVSRFTFSQETASSKMQPDSRPSAAHQWCAERRSFGRPSSRPSKPSVCWMKLLGTPPQM